MYLGAPCSADCSIISKSKTKFKALSTGAIYGWSSLSVENNNFLLMLIICISSTSLIIFCVSKSTHTKLIFWH